MRLKSALLSGITLSAILAACGGGSATPPVASSAAPASAAAKPSTAPASAKPVASAAASVSAKPAASAAAKPSGGATGVKTLLGAGATFPFPLYTKMFDGFQKQSGVQVNYQSIGSGGGLEQLTKKTVDFGASDAPMTAEQEKAAGGAVLHMPMTIGAVALGYNLPNVKGLKLDAATVSGIYLGEIKSWDDPKITALNPDLKLPKTPIAVVYRSDGSGTTFQFTAYLSAVSPDWKSKVGNATSVKWPVGIGGKGNEGVAGQVSQTPGAIGYIELAYVKQNNIAYATLKNQAGKFVEPSSKSASQAAAGAVANMPKDLKALFPNAPGDDSYPISGFSWIIVYQDQSDANKTKTLIDLVTYMITTGQSFAEPLFYAPLPANVQDLDKGQLKKITVAGKPL